jgi:lactoylglutathione lyase
MPNLDHIALEVSDIDRSIEFYTTKIGFTLVSRSTNEEEYEEYCFLKSGDFILELLTDTNKEYLPKGKIERPYCPHISFKSENMKKTVKDLQSKNITIIRGPLEKKDEGTWLYFTDPDGNILEYMQWY